MEAHRRPLAIVLTALLAAAGVTFAIDITTLRITPDVSHYFQTQTYTAFPGERIHVELAGGWTPVRSSNPAAVSPVGDDWFVARAPGRATLTAITLRCPACEIVTLLWRADVHVRLPGT